MLKICELTWQRFVTCMCVYVCVCVYIYIYIYIYIGYFMSLFDLS